MLRKREAKRRRNYIDDTTFGYSGKPVGDSSIKDHISIKSLRDLPKSSYALKADPYAAALPTSEPYPILNKFNRVVGGTYSGDDNIDGGNVQQYANSTKSNFLKAFDIMRMKIDANYRYLPLNVDVLEVTTSEGLTVEIDTLKLLAQTGISTLNKNEFKYNSGWHLNGSVSTVTLSDYGISLTGSPSTNDIIDIEVRYPGIQLIEEMRKSIAESMSILQSTTYTQMAINNFAVATDLPMGSSKPKDITPTGASNKVYAYTSTTDVMYAISIYYQLVLQNALSVMNWHNSFRVKQGTMIRNAFNREVPSLNSFFGLMNKKAFISMLDSINLSFEGEYIDRDFMEQMNMLTLMPSRRSNSITDPILELQCGFNHPATFKIYYLDSNGQAITGDDGEAAPIFDDANMKLTIPYNGVATEVTFWEACNILRDLLSMEDTQLWARESYTPAGISGTDSARYNQIKFLFDVIVATFTMFKPAMADFREAFDVMVRTGTISWVKGFKPTTVQDTDAPVFWNILIDHIYQLIMSGAHDLNYDDATKRWRTFSLWNMYSGIPSYDTKSGGSFLTLSFKNFSDDSVTSEQFEYLPLLFTPYSNNAGVVVCAALSRDGEEAVITQYNTNIQNDVVLNRLAPLASQSNLEIRIPTVSYDSSLSTGHYSNLYKTLVQVFGLARIQSIQNGSYDIGLDPDILAVYQIEITDITNMAITYARSNAPFRGTTSKEGLLGFSTIGKKQ